MKVKKISVSVRNETQGKIIINTDNIDLSAALKLSGALPTGGAAKRAVQDGDVFVNGSVCTVRGRKLKPGDKIVYGGKKYEVIADDN
jgi:ribosome-associated protein